MYVNYICVLVYMYITTRVVVVAIGDVLYYIELEFNVQNCIS